MKTATSVPRPAPTPRAAVEPPAGASRLFPVETIECGDCAGPIVVRVITPCTCIGAAHGD